MALFQFVFAILTSLAPAPVAALTSNTITLAASPNPSVFGSAVTLTANVSPSAATGRVTFYDAVTILGIATLSGGQAALTTKLLPGGTRTLKAYYSGAATFAASTSVAITQTVSTTAQNGLQPAVNYAVGNSPISVAVGDFNGDGRADLAVANSDDKVSVLLGNGDGTFQAAVNYSAGNNDELRGVAVADFNGDGRADLVVANYNSFSNTWGIAVLLGNGDGTFQAPVIRNTQGIPIFVAVGDFNGDGRADVAIANYRGQGVSVLLGNGDGTFGSEVQYGVGSDPRMIVVADFNGDGRADLAVRNMETSNISILLGNGDGTFQAAITLATSGNMAVGDVNGDGRPDLLVTDGSSIIGVFQGNGDGTFRSTGSYSAGNGPTSIAMGDFNGDGRVDLAVADRPTYVGQSSNTVSVLLGNGDGTFQPPFRYGVGAYPSAIVVGDFNGDGRADVAVANQNDNNVSILLGAAPAAPVVGASGIVDGASFSQGAVAPGSLISLFGQSLAAGTTNAAGFPLPGTLAGAQVLVNNATAPLIYVSPTQINFQMPAEATGTSANVIVASAGFRSTTTLVTMQPQAPGIFTVSSNGTGQGAVLNQDNSANSATNAAPRGSVIQIFATGLGATNPTLATGQPGNPSEPLNRTVVVPTVSIGGISAQVGFSGAAPGFVGLYQVNATIPANTQVGSSVSLQIAANGLTSNVVTIAVQ